MTAKGKISLLILAVIILSCWLFYDHGLKDKTKTPPLRILFIGNSFTSFNGGIGKQLEGLAPSIDTQMITPGGFNLHNHWNGEARNKIQEGKWDYVILQEQSQLPVINPEMFFQYGTLLNQETRKAEAKTVFIMTWERPDSLSFSVTTENLSMAYQEIGRQTGALVAPVGTAFRQSLRTRPDIPLYGNDGHPTVQGTFLAACVLYATILKKNPVGNPFAGIINKDIGNYLKQVAAESVGFDEPKD